MGRLSYPKTGSRQSRISFWFCHRFHPFFRASLLVASLNLLAATLVNAQEPLLDKAITIEKQSTTLYGALNLISKNSDCLFIYDSEVVKSDKRVKLQAENQPLSEVLDNILSLPGLSYKVLGRHILIYKPVHEPAPPAKIEPATPGLEMMKYIVIKGRIYDHENRSPIPYATVGIVEENIGTITNSDGFFLIKIPDSLAGTSLVVSHLGYLSQQIPVRLLNDQLVDLYLRRRIISIQEVIIRYIDPVGIIEKAMEMRRANYAAGPVYLTTFYREGVQKNDKYTSYSEAVFKVYKSPYDAGSHADQVKLLKSRKVQDTAHSDTVFLKLKAGVQSALQLDIVKYVPGFLDQIAPVEYTYSYSNLVSYNARDAYAVAFVQNNGLKKPLFKGSVYIEKESFAILGADFEINPDYLDLAAAELVLKKSHRLKVKLKKVRYTVSFMPYNGRYYLGHARCDIEVTTRLKHHLWADHFYTFLELATCNIDTAGVVKFPKQQLLKPGVVFSDQPYKANDDFWRNFNIIAPEAKLSDALSGIIGKIEQIE